MFAFALANSSRFLTAALGAAVLASVPLVPAIGGASDTVSGSSPFTVFNSIDIEQVTELAFGTIVKPSGPANPLNFETFRVKLDGSMVEGDESDGSAGSGQHTGVFDITGTALQGYTLLFGFNGCDTTGIDMVSMDSDASFVFDSSGEDLGVKLGGTVRITSAATFGPHTCAYSLTVSY